MDIAVVTGNPKPGSRTHEAAKLVAGRLGAQALTVVIDVVELGGAPPRVGQPRCREGRRGGTGLAGRDLRQSHLQGFVYRSPQAVPRPVPIQRPGRRGGCAVDVGRGARSSLGPRTAPQAGAGRARRHVPHAWSVPPRLRLPELGSARDVVGHGATANPCLGWRTSVVIRRAVPSRCQHTNATVTTQRP